MVEYRANGQVSNPEVSDLHTEGDPRVGVITGEMDKWEARKRMTKRFYDDGSMSFFWLVYHANDNIVNTIFTIWTNTTVAAIDEQKH